MLAIFSLMTTRSCALHRVVWLCLSLAVATFNQTVRAADLNADGMGDFWQVLFGAEALEAAGDDDGDGATNAAESIAGTDPFDAASVFSGTLSEILSDSAVVRWKTLEGWTYQLQSLPEGGSLWEDEGQPFAGTGAEMTVALPEELASGRAFRLTVALPGALPQIDMSSLLATYDSDGDGDSDLVEFVAGKDPHDGGSTLQPLTGVPQMRIELPTVAGKTYQCERLENGVWLPLEAPFAGAAGVMQRMVAAVGARTMVRYTVTDADADGDGASNWEEIVAGSDPQRADSQVGYANDAEWLAALAADPPVVSLDPAAGVACFARSRNGTLRLLRAGNPKPIDVNLSYSGEAVGGVDYEPLPTSVSFAAGVREIELPIVPLSVAAAPLSMDLRVTLEPGAYTSGGSTMATARVVGDSALVVTSFGATGDGSTDDTAAVQAALDAFASDQSVNRLHFPAGQYRLDTSVTDPETRSDLYRILELRGAGLDDRDLVISGEEGSVLFSTVSPVRANMLVVRTRIRSLRFDSLTWEQDSTPLTASPGSEPNRAAGLTINFYDDRRIDSLDLYDCKFINCHGAASFYNSIGYDMRGLLTHFRVIRCEVLNPYGANTENSTSAFGGGQQFYLPPWVGRAEYRDSLFDGGGENMTDSTKSPGGRLKDGGHFGSPLELVFEGNTVRRMGVEALFHTNQATLMGGTGSSFVIPEADGSSTVQLTMRASRSTYRVGDVINLRTELTPTSLGANTILRVEAVDASGLVLTVSNTGSSYNAAPGSTVPANATVYLESGTEQQTARIRWNYFDGRTPPGSSPPAAISGIVVSTKADILSNIVVGYGKGIQLHREGHTLLNIGTRQSVVAHNIVQTRNPALTFSYTYGIESWGVDDKVVQNFVLTEFPRRTFGIGLSGKRTLVAGNHVTSTTIFRNGYNSGNRAVGIGCNNPAIRTESIGNWTRGFDVGMGGISAGQSIPHLVRDHRSLDDAIGVDPLGAFTEWP